MSNKPFNQLLHIEQTVRLGKQHLDAVDGTRLIIEFISGFEKFNTRPHHNYESWGQGWRITDPETDITLEREDLDDAIYAWREQLDQLEARA